MHLSSNDAPMPSLCKPQKHGKHTPGRRESRRNSLAAEKVWRQQRDDLIEQGRGLRTSRKNDPLAMLFSKKSPTESRQ